MADFYLVRFDSLTSSSSLYQSSLKNQKEIRYFLTPSGGQNVITILELQRKSMFYYNFWILKFNCYHFLDRRIFVSHRCRLGQFGNLGHGHRHHSNRHRIVGSQLGEGISDEQLFDHLHLYLLWLPMGIRNRP